MPPTMDGPLPPIPLEPPYDPPTAALPPIPTLGKARKSLPSLPTSRLPSAPPTPSKLRIPSRIGLPVPNSPAQSSPNVPTIKDISNVINTAEVKVVRRSVSIAAFPQPPKSASRIGKLNSRPSLGPPLVTSNLDSFKSTSKGSTTPTTSISSADSGKPKGLKRPAKSAPLPAVFPNKPSLLNGSGDNVTVSAAAPSTADGLLSPPSPVQSRSSSAQGSYSTQATTFEEDESPKKGREGQDGNDDDSVSSGDSKGNVLVSVRVRPDTGGDKKVEGEWMVDGRRSLVAFRGKEGGDYYYDNVFATHDENGRVYEACAKRLVRRVMAGYHGTVFAYGMTGTGKTFSMQGTTESPGVIPRAITDIFSFIRETPHREFLLRASYLEIYNEEIRDLLAPFPIDGAAPEKIKLREDGKRGVYAAPLREEIVQSPMQLLRVIARGDKARHTGTTQYNAHSSRSHAVVQIVVESRDRAGTVVGKRAAIGPGGVRVSTLSLIDLAGSERAADSKERRTEGAHINKSLLTLGTVIARLSGNKDKNGIAADKDGQHLPYRDSKLTRLLQPALSGNSLISILCTIQIGSAGSAAIANNHTGETLNTLKFAARAKNNIVSHAKKAEEAVGTGSEALGLLERYRAEIQELRQQLDHQNQVQLQKEEEQLEKDAKARHRDQLLELQLARTALKERIEHLNRLILSSQSTGVNSGRAFSALGMHTGITSLYNSQSQGSQSMRSSTSLSTLRRTLSGGSTATPGQRAPLRASNLAALDPAEDLVEEEEVNMNSEASLEVQIRELRTDLAEKTRYISTLERRLIQARRSSNPRTSGGFTGDVLREKDAEIAELRAQLEERDRTVASLRESTNPTDTIVQPYIGLDDSSASSKKHRVQASNGSSSTTTTVSTMFSPVELNQRKSPFELLGGDKMSTAGTSPAGSIGVANGSSSTRKNLDEMSRMLDEMIQEKVEKGELVSDRKNGVRATNERRKESLSGIPVVGALGSKLKKESRENVGLGVIS